jgi:hypothetical protein
MKKLLYTFSSVSLILLMSFESNVQEFQGQAYYFSKTPMELGSWGARMSEAEKKQTQERLKNRLEKTYILNFNREEAVFVEEEKVDAISGATDSWGSNFTRGKQYKNVKENNLMIVEQHRTLAAPDAYSARGGYLSGRDAKVITYHRAYGEVSRLTINSEMLKS